MGIYQLTDRIIDPTRYPWGFHQFWTPGFITTALWLDAADSSTITLDGSSNVEQWDDKSGNDRHAVQLTTVNRPGLSANGLPDFNGVDQFMLIAHDAALNIGASEDFSLYVVHSPRSRANRTVFAKGGVQSSDLTLYYWEGDIRIRYSGTSFDRQFAANNGDTIAGLTRLSGSAMRLWNTNPLNSSTGASSVAINNLKDVSIGAFDEGVDRRFDGIIHEIIFTKAGASQANNDKIEGYLAYKWGLVANLPSDHPYKNVAP